MSLQQNKGILLLALGHPFYGRYAVNLAMSIKASDPSMPIALAYTESAITHFNDHMKSLFDHMILVDAEHYTKNGKVEYIKAKTSIYDLTPFSETVYLDVDMIWLPNNPIGKLFDELKDVDFTIQNRGFVDISNPDIAHDHSWWVNVKEMKDAYEFKEGKYFTLSSELIYFKKKKEVKKFFADAKKIYDNIKVKYMEFAGGIPDELVFSISMIKNNFYPHLPYYTPVYWEKAELKRMHGKELQDKHVAYSLGGRQNTPQMSRTYDNLVTYYSRHFGVQNIFKAQNKNNFLKQERSRV
jgi:hypothetical protein